jgi:hypothetical protein
VENICVYFGLILKLVLGIGVPHDEKLINFVEAIVGDFWMEYIQ